MTRIQKLNTIAGIAVNSAGISWAATTWYFLGYAPWIMTVILCSPLLVIASAQAWEKLGATERPDQNRR